MPGLVLTHFMFQSRWHVLQDTVWTALQQALKLGQPCNVSFLLKVAGAIACTAGIVCRAASCQ
jgi:hypothetical protein